VLSYEERLQRASEDLRIERANQEASQNSLEFWRARLKELEGRLQMYEGKKILVDAPTVGGTTVGVDSGVGGLEE